MGIEVQEQTCNENMEGSGLQVELEGREDVLEGDITSVCLLEFNVSLSQ